MDEPFLEQVAFVVSLEGWVEFAARGGVRGRGCRRKDQCVQDGETAKIRPPRSELLFSLDPETTVWSGFLGLDRLRSRSN